jgi:DNA polymerase III subunit delta'
VFDVVAGQQHAKTYFARALERGGLSHAYLLAGEPGLGKAVFARELAAAIVSGCEGHGDCEPCPRPCADAQREARLLSLDRARRGLHPDLAVIEREGELIRIDQVERLVAELALKPFSAERRAWVILEADKLTGEAANKLLKSLEEPPAHVFFILVSGAPERVLPTIVSRCQTIAFTPLPDAEVELFVRERYTLNDEQAAACARLARGSAERAARLAEDERGETQSRRARYLRLAARIAAADRSAEWSFIEAVAADELAIEAEIDAAVEIRVAELERAVADKREFERLAKRLRDEAKRRDKARAARLSSLDAVDHLMSWLRDLWVSACGAPQTAWNQDHLAELSAASVARPERYARLLELAAETRKDMYLNIDRRLALQAMFSRFQEVDHRA